MTTITPLPKPPTTQDSLNFDIRADEFLESLPKFAEELNAFGENIDNVGNVVEKELVESIIRGKEEIKSATNEGINSINTTANKREKELKAIEAIKSDSWQNIAQYILILLKDIRAKREKEALEKQRMLEYKLFFRSSLPKGYVKPNSLVRIRDCPFAWFYTKQTDKALQESVPYGFFRLPQGNLYTKGVSERKLVGSFGEQQLLEHSHNYKITNLANGSDRMRGGLDSYRDYSRHLSHSSVATSVVGAKTNEVNRIHLLEGYYVGE